MAGIVGRVGMGSDVSHIRAVLKEIFENAAIRRNAEMLIDGSDIRSREAAIHFQDVDRHDRYRRRRSRCGLS